MAASKKAKRATAKKPAAQRTAPKKKIAARRTAAKKPAATKKSPAQRSAAKKPAATNRRTAAKKPAATNRRSAAKKPAATKKSAAVAKKPAAAKKSAARRTAAKKPAATNQRTIAIVKAVEPQRIQASPQRPTSSASQGTIALKALSQRQLRLELPRLGAMSPGHVWIWKEPETHDDDAGRALIVLGSNMAGIWFVLGDDGAVHLVDDCERELGMKVFASVGAFADEVTRQNT
jgi:hypothetical protein